MAKASKPRAKPVAEAPRRIEAGAWVLGGISVVALLSTWGASGQAEAVDLGAALLGIAGVAAAAIIIWGAVLPPLRHRLAWAWGGFLAWALVATLASGRVWSALAGEWTNQLGWATLAAVTLVAMASAVKGRSIRDLLIRYGMWVVIFECVTAFSQLLSEKMPAGTLPNSTYLGEALLALLPWVLVEDERVPQWERRPRLLLSVIAVAVLAAAGSRTAVVVGVAWLAWALVRRTGLGGMKRFAVAAGVIAVIAAAGLVFARGEIVGSAGAGTLGQRPNMWATAARAVAERPVLGFGPDGFLTGGASVTTTALAKTGTALVFMPSSTDPHNLLVWVAVSTGVVGLLLFAWAFVELVLAWRARAGVDPDTGRSIWAVVGPLLVFLTAPAAIQVLPLFGVVLGASLAMRGSADGATGKERPLSVAAAVVLAVACVVMAANMLTRLPLEAYGKDVSPRKALRAESAYKLWAPDAHLAYLASLHLGYAVNANPSLAGREPDVEALRHAVAVDSRDPFVALEFARTLRFYRKPAEEVDGAFRATFERWPWYPTARADYALFLAQQGRFDQAREQLAIAELATNTDAERTSIIEDAKTLIEQSGQ